jgi:hypothetical protein
MLIVFADGMVEKKEVTFCEDVFKQFSLRKDIVNWLLTEVFDKGKAPASDEWDEMRELAKEKFPLKK